MPQPEPRRSSAALILVTWLVVGLPAAWGIYNTALNARKLFTAAPSASSPAR